MDFENRDGFPLHKHARFAWLGSFFESLNRVLLKAVLS